MSIEKEVFMRRFFKSMVRGTLLLAVAATFFFSETMVNKARAYLDPDYSAIVPHTAAEAQACFESAFNSYGLASYGLTIQMFENMLLKESGLTPAQCAETPNVHQNGCGPGEQYSTCGWGCTQMDDGGTLQSVAGSLGYGTEAFKTAIMTDACMAFKAGAYVLHQKAIACGGSSTANTILCSYNMGEANGCSMTGGCAYSQCITEGNCVGGGGGAASGILWSVVFGTPEKQCTALSVPSMRDVKLAALSAVSGDYPSSPKWENETVDISTEIASGMLFGADAAVVAAHNAARGLPLKDGGEEIIIRDDQCVEKLEGYLGAGGAKHTFYTHNTVNNFIKEDAFKKCDIACKTRPTAYAVNGPTSILCSSGSYKTTVGPVQMPSNALSVFQELGKNNANRTSDYSGFMFTYEGK